jgi:hypothetical protein
MVHSVQLETVNCGKEKIKDDIYVRPEKMCKPRLSKTHSQIILAEKIIIKFKPIHKPLTARRHHLMKVLLNN